MCGTKWASWHTSQKWKGRIPWEKHSKCENLVNLRNQEVKFWMILATPILQILLALRQMRKVDFLELPIAHKTTFHSAKHNCSVNRRSSFRSCIFCFLKYFVRVYLIKSLKRIQSLFWDSILDKWAYQLNGWRRRYNFFGQNCRRRQQSRKKLLVFFGTILFQISDCLFVPTFCQLADYSWLISKNCDESNVWVVFLRSAAGYILPPAKLWTKTPNFYKKLCLRIIGWSIRDKKNTTY